MKKIVIGLVGPIKAGKGEISRYLVEKYNASIYRFSHILGRILSILYLSQSRENLQNLAISLRREFGSGVLIPAIEAMIKGNDNSLIVIDGIRMIEEAEMIKKMNGILIYINASNQIRYDRLQKPEKTGEELLTFEQFMEAQKKETELLIVQISQISDFAIINDTSVKDLHNAIDLIIKRIRR